jgi:NAD(P)-dependent dehydrogenase (short-subunit alcohol dehydrogenase family)
VYPTLRCAPELFEKDLGDRTYLVTGSNSGTGLATTEQLVRQGAHVVGACRRVDAGKEAAAHVASAPGSVEILQLDLASLESVRSFASAFLDGHERLHGLVNNAGVMNTPEGRTEDGFETQIGINYLGHFLLTELLLPTLAASAPARIVDVSSVMHVGTRKEPATVDLDDLDFDRRPYSPRAAYAQSKLALVLHAAELARRL